MTEREHGQLVGWLKANVLAAVMAITTLTGGAFWSIYAMGRYFQHSEAQIEQNEADLRELKANVRTLQTDIVSVDKRLNEGKDMVRNGQAEAERERNAIRAASDASDAQLKARIDVLEALAKYNTERLTQPALPAQSYGQRR